MAATAIRALAVGLCLLAAAGQPAAARRLALVVGIDAYDNVDNLGKAVSDARAVGGRLRELGFEVLRSENAPRRELNRALLEFTSAMDRGDTALFFYAGHGVRIEGRNFLLPSDIPAARPGQESFVAAEAIAVDDVLDAIRGRGARISVLILDACRDNPFAREGTRSLGGTRGLARMSAPEGTFIMYSAGVGQTALDRLGDGDPDPNSVFTRSLLPLLGRPGLSMTDTARQVRREVTRLAKTVAHDQRPAYYDEITSEFALVPGGATTGRDDGQGTPPPAPPRPAVDDKAIELAFWNSIRGSDNPAAFESYLAKYPSGDFAALARLRIDELRTPKPPPTPPPVAQPPVVTPTPQPQPQRHVSPSYDCNRAQLPTEVAICRSSQLAELDLTIAQLYKLRRSQGSAASRSRVRDYQRAWLASRNACGYDEACIRQRYLEQIAFLRSYAG